MISQFAALSSAAYLRKNPRAVRAFTLFELLIVIAIISILFAMIFPVIRIVRDSAYQTRCAANMRQLGLGIETYTMNNRGFMPQTIVQNYPPFAIETGGLTFGEYWYGKHFVGPYLERSQQYEVGIIAASELPGALVCPASRIKKDPSGWVWPSYGLNSNICGYVNGWAPTDYNPDAWPSSYNTRQASVSRQADRVLLVDGCTFAFNPGGSIYDADSLPPPAAGSWDDLLTDDGGMNGKWASAPAPYDSQLYCLMAARRHKFKYITKDGERYPSGMTNMLFMDGHVRSTYDTGEESRNGTALFRRGY